MEYLINCVCGEKVLVDASEREAAIGKMVEAMDAHVAAAPHPQVPKDLTAEQKLGMVRQQMKP